MEDAGKVIEKAVEVSASQRGNGRPKDSNNDDSSHKRKGNFHDSRMRHGSQRGGRNDHKRHKKGDLGRGAYL